MRSSWNTQMAPKSMTSVLRRDRREDTECTQERRPGGDRGRDWSSATKSQGTPGATRRLKKQGFYSRVFGRSEVLLHLDFRLLVPRTGRKYVSVVLSYPVYGIFPHHSQKTNTKSFFLNEYLGNSSQCLPKLGLRKMGFLVKIYENSKIQYWSIPIQLRFLGRDCSQEVIQNRH